MLHSFCVIPVVVVPAVGVIVFFMCGFIDILNSYFYIDIEHLTYQRQNCHAMILFLLSHFNSFSFAVCFYAGVSKIIFASRTHSQLSQAIQELRRTPYSQ